MRIKTRILGTLFDRHYAAKGYALLESLRTAHATRQFTQMTVLALDDWTSDKLTHDPPFPMIEVLKLPDFEKGTTLPLLRASRSWKEYCWTLASQLAWRLMKTGSCDQVTYLDSDLYFFRKDLSPIFATIGEASVAAVPHRFDERHSAYAANGRYNVSWVSFRRDPEGEKALSDWAELVLAHCSQDNGPHGLGDQGYLDRWPATLSRFREIGHPGMGLGPWSLEDMDIATGPHGPTVDGLPLHFYHFHEFAEEGLGLRLTHYPLARIEIDAIYRPYIQAYMQAKKRIDPDAAARLDGTRWIWRARP